MRTQGVNESLDSPSGKSEPSTEVSASAAPAAARRSAAVAAGDVVLFRWDRHEAIAEVTEKGAKVEGLGVFKAETVVGKPWGGSVTVGAQTVHLLQPSLPDFIRLLKRGAQIITMKDAAVILANTAVGAGAFVVEFGVGSGALTLALLHAVGPAGRVISVDNNPKHIEVARKNVARTPWGGWWQMREGDCTVGIPETGADALVM